MTLRQWLKRRNNIMCLLRQLKKIVISQIILKRFYYAMIENVLTFSITAWFGRASYEQKSQLETLVKQLQIQDFPKEGAPFV